MSEPIDEIFTEQETELIFRDGYELIGMGESSTIYSYVCRRPDNKIVKCYPIETRQIDIYKGDE